MAFSRRVTAANRSAAVSPSRPHVNRSSARSTPPGNRPILMTQSSERTSTPGRMQNAPEENLCVSIPSDTAAGQEVQERIVAILERLDYPHRDVFGIRLALEEALVNAIKHGNRMDPNKRVRVDCKINSNRVRIEIEDEGDGFRLEDVPDPTDDGNLERPCGRGIMLMRHFLNTVEYNPIGNKVLLEKLRADEPDE